MVHAHLVSALPAVLGTIHRVGDACDSVSTAGCQQRGPLSPRSRCHCPQSHGRARLPEPLPTGMAVQGRYLSYIFRPSSLENMLYHLFINGNLSSSMPASCSVSQLLTVDRRVT